MSIGETCTVNSNGYRRQIHRRSRDSGHPLRSVRIRRCRPYYKVNLAGNYFDNAGAVNIWIVCPPLGAYRDRR